LIARTEQLSPADALVRMAEIALVALNDATDPPRALRDDERAAIVIHVNAEDLAAPPPKGKPASVAPPGRIQDGPGLPPSVLHRLMCAGRIRPVVHDRQGNVLDLGRSHRVVSNRLFRALLLRDERRCTHPGCGSMLGLEAHHVRHWLWGGRTDLANLVLLCPRHHRAHHDGEFQIQSVGGARFRFTRSDGVELPASVDLAAHLNDLDRAEYNEAVAAVVAGAATPDWDGQRLERQWAVGVLADRRRLAGREPEASRARATSGAA
jgi:hypothetical protein